jgi:type II secretory pathway component PulM
MMLTFAFAAIVIPDTAMLLACLMLTLAALIFVFWIEPDAADSAPHRSQLDQLLERRDSIYDNIRDLKFENRAGKYAQQDYEQMRDALEQEAAQVLLEIENVTGNQARLARRGSAPPALRHP